MTDRLKREGEVVPVVEEQAVILKRKKLTEGVRVRTVVREEENLVDEPLTNEEVDVERVPLDRWVDGPVPVRQEGDTTIVTLTEEVVVLEKRLRAVEEIRITKRQGGSARAQDRHAPARGGGGRAPRRRRPRARPGLKGVAHRFCRLQSRQPPQNGNLPWQTT